ncbi:unnamed protein product [Phytophthora fragariaefolia]|uniref:Unnamed protein product n=1 Tax=Phytophthora fragariaefolia TaxID=1490495 RepID=A0A9W6XA36_9STRA|nr:unnamed protein product [Phytophthora fragariaefolia]
MNYAFDCFLGIPWLARYQPQIDCLARSVKRPQDFNVSEVFTHPLVAPSDCPHVTVVDGASTTHVVRRASDGPFGTMCTELLTDEDEDAHARRRPRERQTRAHPRGTQMQNETVEQRLPYENEAVAGIPVCPRGGRVAAPADNEAVEQRFAHVPEEVEQRLPHAIEAVEQKLPHDDVAVGIVSPPRVIGEVENELSRLEESASSSSESDTSVSSRGSRRTKTSRQSRRQLKPRHDASPLPDPTESVCTIEYVDGVPSHTRVIEVASPPRDAMSTTSLPGLSW